MEVWFLKHLVYKYVCMCILQDTCMLFTCVYCQDLLHLSESIVTEQKWIFILWLSLMHAVLCFVKTCMCVYRTNAILSKSELLNSMATKHSKKCQSCSSWLFSCGAIILVLVSSTLVLLYAVHWFVYLPADYIWVGFDCAHHVLCG